MTIEIGLWRHSKSQREYQVLGLGYDSETMEKVVIYQGQYESEELGAKPLFVRPVGMWKEIVELEGQKVPRFVKID